LHQAERSTDPDEQGEQVHILDYITLCIYYTMVPETNKVISLPITWYVVPFKKSPFLEPKPNTNNHPYAARRTLLGKGDTHLTDDTDGIHPGRISTDAQT